MSTKKLTIKLLNRGGLKEPQIILNQNQVIFQDPIQGIIACLLNCKLHTSIYHSKKLNIKLQDFSFHNVNAEFNVAGFMGEENQDSKINWIKGDIYIKSDSNQDKIQELKNIAEKACPVYTMLSRGGVDIDLKWMKLDQLILQNFYLIC